MPKLLKLSILLLLVFQNGIVSSQTKVDSLLNLFSKETNPDVRIDLSYKIAKLTYRSNPEKCKQIIFEALSDSNSISDKYLLGRNLNTLGIIYQYQSQFDSSDYYFQSALELANQTENRKLEYLIYGNLAINYRGQGEYEKAIEYFIKVLEENEKKEDYELVAGTLNDIGNTYLYMGNYNMGMKYQKRALKAISQIDTVTNNATSIKANTLNSIGYTLAALDFTDSALYY